MHTQEEMYNCVGALGVFSLPGKTETLAEESSPRPTPLLCLLPPPATPPLPHNPPAVPAPPLPAVPGPLSKRGRTYGNRAFHFSLLLLFLIIKGAGAQDRGINISRGHPSRYVQVFEPCPRQGFNNMFKAQKTHVALGKSEFPSMMGMHFLKR